MPFTTSLRDKFQQYLGLPLTSIRRSSTSSTATTPESTSTATLTTTNTSTTSEMSSRRRSETPFPTPPQKQQRKMDIPSILESVSSPTSSRPTTPHSDQFLAPPPAPVIPSIAEALEARVLEQAEAGHNSDDSLTDSDAEMEVEKETNPDEGKVFAEDGLTEGEDSGDDEEEIVFEESEAEEENQPGAEAGIAVPRIGGRSSSNWVKVPTNTRIPLSPVKVTWDDDRDPFKQPFYEPLPLPRYGIPTPSSSSRFSSPAPSRSTPSVYPPSSVSTRPRSPRNTPESTASRRNVPPSPVKVTFDDEDVIKKPAYEPLPLPRYGVPAPTPSSRVSSPAPVRSVPRSNAASSITNRNGPRHQALSGWWSSNPGVQEPVEEGFTYASLIGKPNKWREEGEVPHIPPIFPSVVWEMPEEEYQRQLKEVEAKHGRPGVSRATPALREEDEGTTHPVIVRKKDEASARTPTPAPTSTMTPAPSHTQSKTQSERKKFSYKDLIGTKPKWREEGEVPNIPPEFPGVVLDMPDEEYERQVREHQEKNPVPGSEPFDWEQYKRERAAAETQGNSRFLSHQHQAPSPQPEQVVWSVEAPLPTQETLPERKESAVSMGHESFMKMEDVSDDEAPEESHRSFVGLRDSVELAAGRVDSPEPILLDVPEEVQEEDALPQPIEELTSEPAESFGQAEPVVPRVSFKDIFEVEKEARKWADKFVPQPTRTRGQKRKAQASKPAQDTITAAKRQRRLGEPGASKTPFATQGPSRTILRSRKRKAEVETETEAEEQVAKPKKVAAKKSGRAQKGVPKAKKAKSDEPVSPLVVLEPPTTEYSIYVSGANNSGQLGVSHLESVSQPTLNANLAANTAHVVQVATGRSHCIALTQDNKILTWGLNTDGQCGRFRIGFETEPVPEEVHFSGSGLAEDTRFVQVVATDTASFVLTEFGSVYGFGTFREEYTDIQRRDDTVFEATEVIGFLPGILRQHWPKHIPNVKHVKQLAAGAQHVLALSVIEAKGRKKSKTVLLAWGANRRNQLGRKIYPRSKRAASSLKPGPCSFPGGETSPRNSALASIGAGAYHSFAIDADGDVYGWGYNRYGQTGIQELEDILEIDSTIPLPTIVDSLTRYKTHAITGGKNQSLALVDGGQCLSWGSVRDGRLGVRKQDMPQNRLILRSDSNIPEILAVPTPINPAHKHRVEKISISADSHSMVVGDGYASGWGSNKLSQLRSAKSANIDLPSEITMGLGDGHEIVDAVAGGDFSIFLVRNSSLMDESD
ncbi:hypothetical protein BJX70DRAFT_402681 [Aspergillus crustosus]